jgi:6-phosphogluconolactonase
MASIQVYSDPSALANAMIDLFIQMAQVAIHERGRFSVALSGGSTPKQVYAGLAEQKVQDQLLWENIDIFFGDERHVLPTDSESNFRMVQEALFSKITIPEKNIYRVQTECDAESAADAYEESLRAYFGGTWPRFDLVLLGMGTDGHTASLFPHTRALTEERRWFVANPAPSQSTMRLTLTKNAINAARQIVVLVSGKSKAQMLKEVFHGPYIPEEKPIQLISPDDGYLLWLLDKDAASQLQQK